MFIDQLAKLQKAKAELAVAEAKLASDRVNALAQLPSQYGFGSLNDFLKAVKAAYGKGGKAAKGKGKAKVKAEKAPKAAKAPKAGKGKRAKITDEVKAQVKSLAEEGKTGQEIAKLLGISAPSVQNIKKALGMVKARASAPAPEAVSEAAPVASSEAPAA